MELDMAMGEERKNKEDEEFAKVYHSTTCEFDEDEEFAKVFNMTAFEFNETSLSRTRASLSRTRATKRCCAHCSEEVEIKESSRHSHNSGVYMQDG
jgi:hypothetical protein